MGPLPGRCHCAWSKSIRTCSSRAPENRFSSEGYPYFAQGQNSNKPAQIRICRAFSSPALEPHRVLTQFYAQRNDQSERPSYCLRAPCTLNLTAESSCLRLLHSFLLQTESLSSLFVEISVVLKEFPGKQLGADVCASRQTYDLV